MRGLLLDVGGVLFGPGSDLDGLSAVVRAVKARGIVTGIVSNDPAAPVLSGCGISATGSWSTT